MIVIVADDMGRHDLTSAGSLIQTPNLDSLSESGVKEGIKSLISHIKCRDLYCGLS